MTQISVSDLKAFSFLACLSLKCQKCDSTGGDCNTGLCEGVWCIAQISENKATRTRTVKKDCASANPAGPNKEDGCVKDAQPDGTEIYRCGCNTADSCNSETGIARMQAMLTNQFSLPGTESFLTFIFIECASLPFDCRPEWRRSWCSTEWRRWSIPWRSTTWSWRTTTKWSTSSSTARFGQSEQHVYRRPFRPTKSIPWRQSESATSTRTTSTGTTSARPTDSTRPIATRSKSQRPTATEWQ